MIRLILVFLFSVWLLASCEKTSPSLPGDSELLDGPVEGLAKQKTGNFWLAMLPLTTMYSRRLQDWGRYSCPPVVAVVTREMGKAT